MSTKDEQFTGYRTNHPDDIAHFASVRSFQDFLVDKTNPVVMVTLTVNDKGFLDNATFETHLTQHTNTHDEFTIVVNDTAIDDFKGQVMKNSKDLLGENITIHFHQFGGVIQSFKGIIANICNKKNEGGGYGKLYISGYAPSIVLDGGKTCQSYENKTLPEIIAEATAEYPQESQIHIEGLINNEEKIPYTVQYNESDYQFIQRLARRYGEFFYYNGTQYIFGSRAQQTITLHEGGDLTEVEFELMIKPQKFNYLSYNSQMTRTEVKGSDQTEPQYKENPFQFAAIQASEKVFAKTTDQTYSALPDEFRGDY
ncbi:phage late control D family protein, partial [Capnocytophaga genosp. AHN8471]|uniref:phage late control D family protein n=1 Tax=Capnocytophaga genosp. AHN8471 TaxID=327574 RepID=UPI001934A6F8